MEKYNCTIYLGISSTESVIQSRLQSQEKTKKKFKNKKYQILNRLSDNLKSIYLIHCQRHQKDKR